MLFEQRVGATIWRHIQATINPGPHELKPSGIRGDADASECRRVSGRWIIKAPTEEQRGGCGVIEPRQETVERIDVG
jgi:hypothetical protein